MCASIGADANTVGWKNRVRRDKKGGKEEKKHHSHLNQENQRKTDPPGLPESNIS